MNSVKMLVVDIAAMLLVGTAAALTLRVAADCVQRVRTAQKPVGGFASALTTAGVADRTRVALGSMVALLGRLPAL
jgi:hypothetical protein